MRIMNLHILFVGLLISIFISGCLGNDKESIDNEIPDWLKNVTEFSLEDIFTVTHVAWEGRPLSSYILIPMLTSNNGEIIYPLNENATTENTIHGICINYSFTSEDYVIIDDFSRTVSSQLYVDENANLTFYPNEDLSKPSRYYKGSPGLSIWEEDNGEIYTWIYTSEPANWIIFRLLRGYSSEDHSTNLADTSGRYNLEPPTAGWHKVKIERIPLWASPA